MSLLDKVIYQLDDQYQNVPFYQDELKDIKSNVQALLNVKLGDCLVANDLGLSNVVEFNLNASDLCLKMAKEICFLIDKYEQRIRVLSIRYDNSLAPWRILFFLRCNFSKDHFNEFDLEIVFKNDRYCEIV